MYVSLYMLTKYRKAVAKARKNPAYRSKLFSSLPEAEVELAELERLYAARHNAK